MSCPRFSRYGSGAMALTLTMMLTMTLACALPCRAGEPAVVAEDAYGVQEPATAGSGLTAFIRTVSLPPDVFHVRDEWSYRDDQGVTSRGAFPLPNGYTESSDPVLAQY